MQVNKYVVSGISGSYAVNATKVVVTDSSWQFKKGSKLVALFIPSQCVGFELKAELKESVKDES